MYKILELNERDIARFNGKIIQVIDSTRREIAVGRDYLGTTLTSYMWVLTCLVEVEK
ncbi:MAG: hypothetical protein J6S85_20820 [Methanobrevibacter sp.]|nr:hypothetical protein [Methanobrevibacter sp.]